MPSPRRSRRRLVLLAAAVAAAVLALSLAWKFTPLSEFANPRALVGLLRLAGSQWMPAAILGAYLLASLVMFPNTVLNVAVILTLGPVKGLAYSLGGSLLAAVVFYTVARVYGADKVRKAKVKDLARITRALERGTIGQVLLIRLLPLAPFSIVSGLAGAARVPAVAFVAGTALALLPGNLMVALFGRQVRQFLANPSPSDVGIMALIVVAASVLLWQLNRFAARRTA